MDEQERQRRVKVYEWGVRCKAWDYMNGLIDTPPTEEDYELPRELMPPISKVSRNKEIE
jgi:hypothetical protein